MGRGTYRPMLASARSGDCKSVHNSIRTPTCRLPTPTYGVSRTGLSSLLLCDVDVVFEIEAHTMSVTFL